MDDDVVQCEVERVVGVAGGLGPEIAEGVIYLVGHPFVAQDQVRVVAQRE